MLPEVIYGGGEDHQDDQDEEDKCSCKSSAYSWPVGVWKQLLYFVALSCLTIAFLSIFISCLYSVSSYPVQAHSQA